jgi:hypothetical protein
LGNLQDMSESSGLDRLQLAGLDDRERGFNRPVEFELCGEGYRAILRYETARVTTAPCRSQEEALQVLIQTLHAQGYRQLRTQVSFRRGVYLGSQEQWIEYQDPKPEPESKGLLSRMAKWLRSRPVDQESP